MTGTAWVDGELVAREDARLPIDDFSARYGAACFETMLARGGAVFRLDAHLDRLDGGLRGMRVAAPSRDALTDAVYRTLEANGRRDASVRLSVSAGRGGAPDLAAAHDPPVVVTVDPVPAAPPPAHLQIVSVRIDEDRPLRDAKVANFLPYLLARAEAREAGVEDALLLNRAGGVAEAATANLFAWIDGALVTPPLEDGPLPGITRAAVLEVARDVAMPCEERTLVPGDLQRAEAVFLTSSVQGMRPVASITGGGVGWRAAAHAAPELELLATQYEALVVRECAAARRGAS